MSSMTMGSPGAPPLPSRHPGRRTVIHQPADLNEIKAVRQEYLHIWEHSVTLYRGFDWQAAAENFLYLSRMIDENLESTKCVLNAAIIFARLGQYSTASGILSDAEPAPDLMAITMFVWGHVEFELGNFTKAEDSFKIALSSLQGRSQSYSHMGLDFTLKASHIEQDLRVFASRNNLYGFLGTLGALPADSIFNPPSTTAPARAQANAPPSKLLSRKSTDSAYVPSLRDNSTPTSPAMSPVDGYFEHDRKKSWGQGSSSQESDVPVLVRHNSNAISEALEDVRAGFAALQLPSKMPTYLQYMEPAMPPPTKSLPPTPSPSIGDDARQRNQGFARKSIHPPRRQHIITQSVDNSKHPALRPRDARIQGGETRELADFILNEPLQNQRQPRGAVVAHQSADDLVHFLRGDRPPSPVSPLPDDASVYSKEGVPVERVVSAVSCLDDRDLLPIDDHLYNPDRDMIPIADGTRDPLPPPQPLDPLSPAPRRRFRDGVASFMGSRPSSIHNFHQYSASSSGSTTPALTALPSVSTRSSSLRISPKTPIVRRLAKKEKPVVVGAPQSQKKSKNQPKMVPVEPIMSYSDFFPAFLAKRMSEW